MFRLLWLNIATQMMLLVAVVAGFSLLIVSRVTEASSQRLLRDRTTGRLADDCLLRAYKLQEAVRSISRGVRESAESHAIALRGSDPMERDKALHQLLRDVARPEDVSRSLIEQVALTWRSATGELRQLARAGPREPYDQKTESLLLEEIRKRLKSGPRETTTSLVFHRDNGGPRYLLIVAYSLPHVDPTSGPVLVVAVNFTRLVELQVRRLPRHLLLLQTAEGKWINHPDRERIGTFNDDWAMEREASEEGLSRDVPLKLHELPELGFYVVRVKLPTALATQPSARRELENRLLATEGLRFSELDGNEAKLTLSAQERRVLKDAEQTFDVQESLLTKTTPVAWPEPLYCSSFVGHRRLDFSLDHESGLNVSVTYVDAWEELVAETKEAVREAHFQFWSNWFIPLVVASAALTLLMAYLLTRPLRRLTEASQRLAKGDYAVEIQDNAPGEVGELARAFRDMTAGIRARERELRENLLRFSTIMSNAADGVLTFDQTGRIEEANAAAEEMFGFPRGGLKGSKVQKLMKLPEHLQKPVAFSAISGSTGSSFPQFGGTVTQLFNAVKTPGEEHRGLRQDGTTFWMEVTFSQVPLEDRRMIIGIFRDITRRKLDEERIRQMNNELDARVRLRTAQLEDTKVKLELALSQAESANAAKDRFISVVSHELRTPLTSAMGYAELLLNPRATKLRENPGPTLEKILTACKYLSTLINDLLDVSRYTAGKPIDLAPTRFALEPFLKGVQEMVTPLVRKNGNALEVSIPPNLGEICNDETRLRQILLNLLSNAGKFTENGKVSLQVERHHDPEHGDWMVFQVSDTGGGMTPEQQEKLFTPFYRIDNSMTRKQGGTGLGLTITKMLCELMGGSIRVSSVAGEGSTFVVTLPAEVTGKLRKSSDLANAEGDANAHRGTVLVIDDDPTIRHMLETYLQQEGHHVLLAGSGDEGLRLARERQPTCITLDVLMPTEDGWDVLARLKNDPITRDVPVIMLTIMEERNRGFALGATEYVTKPIDWGRLGSILCRYNPSQAPILIVEDDALQRGYLREELLLAGWSVLEASNGEEALRVCDKTTPSLILLDLTMPIMDGFAFLEEFRRREGGAEVPVVVLTARDLSDDERRRLNRSVAQVLAKESLSKDRLLGRIREQLQAATRARNATTSTPTA